MKNFLDKWGKAKPNPQFDQAMKELRSRYPEGEDPWGLNIKWVDRWFRLLWPLYRHYFKVRVFGEEHLPTKGAYVLVANHSGQVAIDGLLIGMAFFSGIKKPRVIRPMVDRFVFKTPFAASILTSLGGVLGDRHNCQMLLKKGESVLVFPEGVAGIAKDSSDYYQLKEFSSGFFRMALVAGVPIVPLSVVGCEEFYPFVRHLRGLAKALGLPALPLSANLWPLPSPVDIYIGKPYELPATLGADALDGEVEEHVAAIAKEIEKMLQKGLKNRRPFLLAKSP